MTVHEDAVHADNASAVRTAAGGFAVPVPAVQKVPMNVRDQGANVRGCVHRALLRASLGESYAYDVVPIAVPDGTGRVEVGYVLYASTALAVPIGSRVGVASKPFEFDAPEDLIIEVTNAVVEALRTARTQALRMP